MLDEITQNMSQLEKQVHSTQNRVTKHQHFVTPALPNSRLKTLLDMAL